MYVYLKILKINCSLKKTNSTIKINRSKISESNINWLKKIYKKDFDIYNKYKSLNIDKRIKI